MFLKLRGYHLHRVCPTYCISLKLLSEKSHGSVPSHSILFLLRNLSNKSPGNDNNEFNDTKTASSSKATSFPTSSKTSNVHPIESSKSIIHSPLNIERNSHYNGQQITQFDLSKEIDEKYQPPPFISTSSLVSENSNPALKRRVEDWGDKINAWYAVYQDAAGISEVRRSQEHVKVLMDSMSSMSSRRRELQADIARLHQELNATHARITNSPRYSQEHTLLFEQARELTTNLDSSKLEFELLEGRERDCLTQVMSAIRVSHERERTQQQHTNYRTIVISLITACFAAVVTFITNLKRTRDTNSRIKQTEVHTAALHAESRLHLDQLLQHNFDTLAAHVQELQQHGHTSNYADHAAGDNANSPSIHVTTGDHNNDLGSTGLSPDKESSIFQIGTHMATGAILGTLMAAVIFGNFK